jgi:hypothetical protein
MLRLPARPLLPIAVLLCLVLGTQAARPMTAAAQIYALPRPDTLQTETFGVSVAIDGDYIVVGASGENACGTNSGAAYVFERRETTGPWQRVARLVPRDCRENAFFGEQVDISGERIIVSASSEFFADEQSNRAYIFERRDGTWTETGRLTSRSNDEEGAFAAGVALEGNRAVVTTSGSPEGEYGGAVYVFSYDPLDDRWTRDDRMTARRGTEAGVLGGTVALSGDRIAVAASTYFEREPGSVYLFEQTEAGTWNERSLVRDVDDFFISLSLDNDTLLVGESQAGDDASGEATLHARTEQGAWTRLKRLQPSTPYESGAFGSTVSLDGDWALVTGYDEQLGQDVNIDRVVYVYRRDDEGAWQQRTIIDIGEVAFGAAIDQDGSTAVISSVPESAPGAVYVVHLH